ncbi:tetratricopeptide repeat protein [Amycolatopsis sp. NPDC058278]|uniref:tetratricopeptide repeat protein n=1 Tax=Amycolatopsis sp. NPDC058278 TaxID=3346417 RepID=UPI0036D87F2E
MYTKECAERDEPNLNAVKVSITDFYAKAVTMADCHLLPCRDGQIRPTPPLSMPPHLSGYQDAMAWLSRENATLLAVIDFATRNKLADHVRCLARALDIFLGRSGQLHERAAVHRRALEVATDDHGRLAILPALARALARLGRIEESTIVLDEATELLPQAGGGCSCPVAVHHGYVLVYELQQRYSDALRHALRAWELTRDQPNLQRQADALNAVPRQRALLGFPAEALPLVERALRLYRELGRTEGEATALSTLGHTHKQLRKYDNSIAAHKQSLAIDRKLGSRYWKHTRSPRSATCTPFAAPATRL